MKNRIAEKTIDAQKTVELVPCDVEGVREAKVIVQDNSLVEWDRFMRLSQVAKRVNGLTLPKGTVVLDVGGFDGAFALFVPALRVWVVDPATTTGSGLALPFPDKHFNVVVSIDALEHVPRPERSALLKELVRVTKSKLFINYPEARSMDAQKQVLSLIPNKFIKEHVEYVLPSRDETIANITSLYPNIEINATGHTSINIWVAWYVLFHTMKERGLAISEFLKTREQVNQDPFLYDLLECDTKNTL
jgi:SAM-dependent methyltransferase